MIAAVVCGLLIAAGIWAIVRGAFPAPPKLSRLAAEYNSHPNGAAGPGAARSGSRWSRIALAVADAVQGDDERVRQDLAVVGLPTEEFASDKLTAGALGAAIVGGSLFAVGLARGPLLVIALLGGFVGFYFAQDVQLRKKAAVRRREFVDTVTAFIGLVSVTIAGGGGVMSAMNAAASLGDGWPLERIRLLLDEAATRNESPWVSLDRLGSELGIPSLVELGGSMSLAAQSGARISESLAARAQSARARELAEGLAEEEQKSEALGIPVVVMLLAWVGFLGYPALVNVMGF